jgi:hypothetical protein
VLFKFDENRLKNKNFSVPVSFDPFSENSPLILVGHVIIPTYCSNLVKIGWITKISGFRVSFNPFSGIFTWNLVGRQINYVLLKFGEDRLKNKNFSVPGVIRPFFEFSRGSLVGRAISYVLFEFGEDRLKNKNFGVAGVI